MITSKKYYITCYVVIGNYICIPCNIHKRKLIAWTLNICYITYIVVIAELSIFSINNLFAFLFILEIRCPEISC